MIGYMCNKNIFLFIKIETAIDFDQTLAISRSKLVKRIKSLKENFYLLDKDLLNKNFKQIEIDL